MMRQPHDPSARAFAPHRLTDSPLVVRAADYDRGPAGVAYADTVDANYHVAPGGERVLWNNGTTYRTDGVDIARDAAGVPFVTDFVTGDSMRSRIAAGKGGRVAAAITPRPKPGWMRAPGDRGGALPAPPRRQG